MATDNIVCLYARQEKTDQAIQWLQKAVEKGDDNLKKTETDPDLGGIRGI
jgi:hypothetical protein